MIMQLIVKQSIMSLVYSSSNVIALCSKNMFERSIRRHSFDSAANLYDRDIRIDRVMVDLRVGDTHYQC